MLLMTICLYFIVEVAPHSKGLSIGYVVNSKVYSAQKGVRNYSDDNKGRKKAELDTVVFFEGSLGDATMPPTKAAFAFSLSEEMLFWRLQENYFWAANGNVTYHTFFRMPATNFSRKKEAKYNYTFFYYDEKVAKYNKKKDLEEAKKKGIPTFTVLSDYFTDPPDYNGDFLPIEPDKILMFVNWNNEIRVKQGRFLPNHKHEISPEDDAEPPKPLDERDYKYTYSISTKWNEPYMVFGSSSEFFFVTVSGKLYFWNNPGKENQEMKALWNDVNRPIEALITDVPAKKTWAFTKGSGNQPGAYFEIKNEIKTMPYRLEKAKEANLPKTYKIVLEYARFLDKSGKIQKTDK